MKNNPFNSSFVAFLLILSVGLFSGKAYALDDGSLAEKIGALNWQKEPGNYELGDINASITISQNEWLVKGKDAHEYMYLMEGHKGFQPDAVVFRIQGPNQDTQVDYTFQEIGYVKTDDWEQNIDKNELLEQIKESTKEANKLKGEGYPDLFVDGWVQEPYLDKKNAIIYWAISAHSSLGESIVNAKALKLGRKGYTEIIWVGSSDQFSNAETTLSPTLAAYQYKEGSTYADFMPGVDTVAAVGAGALVYKLITGKAAAKVGAGLLAMIAIFAKKFWFILIAPVIFAWKWLKGLFTGKNENT